MDHRAPVHPAEPIRRRAVTRRLAALASVAALTVVAPSLARAARPTAPARPWVLEGMLAQQRRTQEWRISRASPRASAEIRASHHDETPPPASVRQAPGDEEVEHHGARPPLARQLVDYGGAQRGPQPPSGISARQLPTVRFRPPAQFLVFGSGSFRQWGHRASGAASRLFGVMGAGGSTPSLRAPPSAA